VDAAALLRRPAQSGTRRARKLTCANRRRAQLHINKIREDYERAWASSRAQERQMGVALYFIDKLALRAGHEKDDDEADTVGCCNLKARARAGHPRLALPTRRLRRAVPARLPRRLAARSRDACAEAPFTVATAASSGAAGRRAGGGRGVACHARPCSGKNPNPDPPRWQVENVECLPDNHIKFDFLGKDSIRYENEVAVHATVWRLVQQFCRGDKKGGARALPAHGPPLPLSHFSRDALPPLLPQLMASAGPHARVPRGLSDCACSSRTRRRTPEPGVSAAHPRLCRCVRCTCGGAAR